MLFRSGGDHVYFLDNFEAEYIKETLENSIKNFYSSPQIAINNYAYANSFSYKKHIDKYLDIYDKMLK